MSCSKPMIRFYNPDDREQSGQVYGLARFFKERLKTDREPNYEELMYNPRVMLIPCGTCDQCKRMKREDWATRMELEAKSYRQDEVYFITLTYSDENIPNLNLETGEIRRGKSIRWKGGSERPQEVQTLSIEDVQLFVKRLRKGSGARLRYFLAGEYGEKTCRPHYHMILYGWRPTDLEPIHKLAKSSHFTSKWLSDKWGYGQIDIAPAVAATYAYVAGYVTKKLYGKDKEQYTRWGMRPPFAVMSRKPGIGDEYFQQHEDELWKTGYIMLSNGKRARIPEYYWDKLKERDPQRAWDIKRERQREVIAKLKYQNSLSSYSYKEQLEIKERKAHKSMKQAKGVF